MSKKPSFIYSRSAMLPFREAHLFPQHINKTARLAPGCFAFVYDSRYQR